MSNRKFYALLVALVMALAAVLLFSWHLGRLTWSPGALGLFVLIILFPAGLLLRAYMVHALLPQDMRERIVELRRRETPRRQAVWIPFSSLIAGYVWVLAFTLLIPPLPSRWEGALVFPVAFGLFLFGWLGLLVTWKWLQRHGWYASLVGLGLTLAAAFTAVVGPATADCWIPEAMVFLTGCVAMITPFMLAALRIYLLID